MGHSLGSLPPWKGKASQMPGLLTPGAALCQSLCRSEYLHLGDDGVRQDSLRGSFQVSDFDKAVGGSGIVDGHIAK